MTSFEEAAASGSVGLRSFDISSQADWPKGECVSDEAVNERSLPLPPASDATNVLLLLEDNFELW